MRHEVNQSTKRKRVPRTLHRVALAYAWCSVLLLFLAGCQGSGGYDTGDGFTSPISPADIAYADLAKRYNENLSQIQTLWARTDVVIEWREQGQEADARREKGEGKLMMRPGGDVALLVEKVGKTLLWAGSNKAGHYWLFDLVDSDNKVLYFGDQATRQSPDRQAYPLPVEPGWVPMLMGLQPLPQDQDGATVDQIDGQYLVELRGQGLRLLVDQQTFKPSRVDVLDRDGFSVLTSKLQGAFPVELPGVRKTRWPSMCERAEIYVAGYASRMTVAMDSATTNPRRVRDTMFDLEKLTAALKPGKKIDLAGP